MNSAGFSDKDYRIGESAKPQIPEQPAEQITLPDQQGCPETGTPLETTEDDFTGVDGKSIGAELERRREQAQTPEIAPKADTMLDAAAEIEKAYTNAIRQTGNDPVMDNLPWEVRDKVKSFQVNPQFREDIEALQIPQFFLKIEQSLFTDGSFELLDKEMLAEGFTLRGKAYDIDFAAADDEIREIDVREQDGGLPKVFKMESAEQRYFKEWFNNLPPESRVRQCKDTYTSLFTQRNEVYSGSEATVFHLVKLFALQQVLRHNCPIIVDSFRAEDLSTGKEKTVLEISKSINNQVILTTTLKHEELGKYDSIEGVNHINYISHIPSKILDGRYVADFLGLLSALSIKVQS